ncbi:hypothetical protein Dacet_2642 [Denitrovibrio acetiphilus DSM 12809]|jgi:hypothetical protein|uniref:Uncharacterized protein n=1 Tax=Denitrovibrio acetiphilus (strain DSM 12809 / NBRC 114555 / N2460) TaxID=522772 RepID=D4H544_DENA2|nr:hypothetical protein [Denitrovibrio acetiphilus]ADD69400.1 hypothetical protein Dacet_2642 [Denitrovibrio acetiphilus DSM 12809]
MGTSLSRSLCRVLRQNYFNSERDTLKILTQVHTQGFGVEFFLAISNNLNPACISNLESDVCTDLDLENESCIVGDYYLNLPAVEVLEQGVNHNHLHPYVMIIVKNNFCFVYEVKVIDRYSSDKTINLEYSIEFESITYTAGRAVVSIALEEIQKEDIILSLYKPNSTMDYVLRNALIPSKVIENRYYFSMLETYEILHRLDKYGYNIKSLKLVDCPGQSGCNMLFMIEVDSEQYDAVKFAEVSDYLKNIQNKELCTEPFITFEIFEKPKIARAQI